MLIWLITVSLAFGFRVWAMTEERKAANAFTLTIYRGKNEGAVKVASGLIDRPTPMTELVNEAADTVPPFWLIGRFFYLLFAFSFATVDARTPRAFTLWGSEEKFYELHDPDVYEGYRNWKAAFFWDGVSAGVLALVLVSVCSRTLFAYLYH